MGGQRANRGTGRGGLERGLLEGRGPWRGSFAFPHLQVQHPGTSAGRRVRFSWKDTQEPSPLTFVRRRVSPRYQVRQPTPYHYPSTKDFLSLQTSLRSLIFSFSALWDLRYIAHLRRRKFFKIST